MRAAAPACLRLCLRIGAHKKRLGPFLCGVGYALRCALSEHQYENIRVGTPSPFSYIFILITASLCACRTCNLIEKNRKVFRFFYAAAKLYLAALSHQLEQILLF